MTWFGKDTLAGIKRYTDKIEMGPFRWLYSSDEGWVHFQVLKPGTNYYTSLMRFDKSGNIDIEGVIKTNQDLDDIGRR